MAANRHNVYVRDWYIFCLYVLFAIILFSMYMKPFRRICYGDWSDLEDRITIRSMGEGGNPLAAFGRQREQRTTDM